MPAESSEIIIDAPVGILRGSELFAPADNEPRKMLQASIALCAWHEARGDTCVPLVRYAGQALRIAAEERSFSWQAPALDEWIAQLLACPLIGSPLIGSGADEAALIINGDYLYLHRLYRHETQLAALILQRNQTCTVESISDALSDLQHLFKPGDMVDWQLLACASALSRSFSVISGGPGTGKTTTLARLIALLLLRDRDTRIRLAAPTGKAATRMAEALQQESGSLDISDEILQLFPQDSQTLHRLIQELQWQPDAAVDCLIIDEASMADISTLNRCLQLLPAQTRIVLVGDPMQLTSVESGSVLKDICDSSPESLAPEFCNIIKDNFGWDLETVASSLPLAGCRISLKRNWRFEKAPGIKALSSTLLEKQASMRAIAARYDDCDLHLIEDNRLALDELVAACLPHYLALSRAADPAAALQQMGRLSIVSAWKRGALGVQQINQHFDDALRRERGITQHSDWYHARPFLVQQNNYHIGIYNGDVGIVWNTDGQLRAFIDSGGQLRNLPLEDIHDCDALYAMSIHKSQGSQYDQVHVVVPERHTEHLSRALFYTAVTRARSQVSIWSTQTALDACITQELQRYTGLPQRLQA